MWVSLLYKADTSGEKQNNMGFIYLPSNPVPRPSSLWR
jgi:hypothetical protein